MGKGVNYWGNESGENTETSNKAGRPDCYPGKQSESGALQPASEPGQKDSIKVSQI